MFLSFLLLLCLVRAPCFAHLSKIESITNELGLHTSGPDRVTVHYRLPAALETVQEHIDQLNTLLGIGSFSAAWSHKIFTGFFVQGVDIRLVQAFFALLPLHQVTVMPSRKFQLTAATSSTSTPNWGLSRISSESRPGSGVQWSSYTPEFTGRGVDVYVVDSGIDTTHADFKPSTHATAASSPVAPQRTVANLFDINFPGRSSSIPANNDRVGHGTHCAGIIGGRTVGVAPAANVYGVKVMDDSGQGFDSSILDGLKFVYERYISEGLPATVVSMSLGGPCGNHDSCNSDPLVLAVETLVAEGLVVVVAAGNSDCDACLTTPAFAPSAVTVGASDRQDRAALFSDYGKCIDVYAPGEAITSTCAYGLCEQRNQFVNMTGTSMSAPFVSGVLAQILEATPAASAGDAVNTLSCIAAEGALDVVQDEQPSTTRNLLLQTPRADNLRRTGCRLGEGCAKGCSGHGFCFKDQCYCDTDWWGATCHTMEFGEHCGDGLAFVPYTLLDTRAESWEGAELRVYGFRDNSHTYTNSYGNGTGTEGVLSTSMCGGRNETNGVCLERGRVYGLTVTATASGSAHIGYSICGAYGGAPSTQLLQVKADGTCALTCGSSFAHMDLSRGGDRGWRNGFYQVMSPRSGFVYAGGTLAGFEDQERHPLCLPQSAAAEGVVVLVSRSSAPSSGSWQFCGVGGVADDDFAFFDTAHSACTHIPAGTSAPAHTYAIGEFNYQGAGWSSGQFADIRVNIASSFSSYDDSAAYSVGRTVLTQSAANQSVYSVPGQFQRWHIAGPVSGRGQDAVGDASSFWLSCGARGRVGETLKFKPSSSNEGRGCARDCLRMESEDKMAGDAFTLLTVTRAAAPHELVEIYSVSVAKDVCLGNSSAPGQLACYRLILGAGSVLSAPTWSLCGEQLPSNAVLDVCVRDSSECALSQPVYTPQCPESGSGSGQEASATGMLLVMYAEQGAGWGDCEFLVYDLQTFFDLIGDNSSGGGGNEDDDSSGGTDDRAGGGTDDRAAPTEDDYAGSNSTDYYDKYLARGGLSSGYTGYDSLCLADGCYALLVTESNHSAASLAWLLCGHIGKAGEVFFFQILDDRCLPVSSPVQCNAISDDELSRALRKAYWYFNAAVSVIYIVVFVFIGMYCCKRSSLYRPASEIRGPAPVLLDEPTSLQAETFVGRLGERLADTFSARPGYTPLHSAPEEP